jgi:hypothetical protein
VTPPLLNGHAREKPTPSADPSDTRVLYMIIGGIVCAFLVGILLLIVAMASDWN